MPIGFENGDLVEINRNGKLFEGRIVSINVALQKKEDIGLREVKVQFIKTGEFKMYLKHKSNFEFITKREE